MAKKDIFKLQNGSDIRGVACDGVAGENINLTAEISVKIGAAFVDWLSIKTGKKACELKIGIGRDSRITGENLLNAVACGILQKGADIVDCGLATTPAMFMSCVFKETDFDGSVMITASHLPFNRNGIKFFDKQGGLDHEDITIILEIAEDSNVQCTMRNSQLKKFDLLSLYSAHLKNVICRELECDENKKPLSGLKIVVDSGNGASGFFVEKILKPLGADTKGSQFLEPDGLFPNHIPNPENKEAMKAIKTATVSNNGDLGLIFDTDVDRMSCVFSNGEEVNRDSIIALISAILAQDYPHSTIVTDSVTSDRLTYFLEKVLGLNHFRFVRGYKNVINRQIELNQAGTVCPLAMETSGHGALSENYFLDDGAYLAVKIIIALAKAKRQGRTLESLIEKLPPAGKEGEYRFKILCEDFEDYGKSVLKEVRNRAEKSGYNLPQAYEGVRISFEKPELNGWILFRMSLHDPVMPVNLEGQSEEDKEKLKEIVKKLVSGFEDLDISSICRPQPSSV
ncbi:MAG: phosphomannomutase/phosphoglucomutase [Treponema sp.]|nr:phosphomannomutase/phosphoglucomutase [Candidatus Treponema equifaecale]